jgi:hypothetical protein
MNPLWRVLARFPVLVVLLQGLPVALSLSLRYFSILGCRRCSKS